MTRPRWMPPLVLVCALLASACGGTTTSAPPTGGSTVGPTAAASGSTSTPTASDEPSASNEPSEEPSAEPSEEPTESPSTSPRVPPSGSPGAAAACTGTTKNQEFYVSVAGTVSWTVYCPVLPAGWHVESGQYRGAGGGKMEIGYKGPGGDHIALREGSFCSDADGCVPSGTEVGSAPFGDQAGTLIAADDGSWAIVVARGEHPSWLLTGTGIDEAAIRAFGAALVRVED